MPEVADVHAREHNLFSSLASRLLSLLHKRGDRRVAREPTRIRYGAIGAEIVAAVLHLEEVAGAVATRARRLERLDVLRLDVMEEVAVSITARFGCCRTNPCVVEILYEIGFLIRAEHKVHTIHPTHFL